MYQITKYGKNEQKMLYFNGFLDSKSEKTFSAYSHDEVETGKMPVPYQGHLKGKGVTM